MCVNHGSSAQAPSHARSTDRLRTGPRSRSSEGGWARAASLRALSEAGQDIREPGKPGAWSGRLGDRCPRKKLWAEAGVMAAGSGGRADAPAPGVLGFSCLQPRIPEHMLFPPPNALPCSFLRPPSCLCWRRRP